MRKFSLWLRGQPLIADSLLALVVFGLDLLNLGQSHSRTLYVATGVVVCLPAALRRVRPVLSAWTLLAVTVVVVLVGARYDEATAVRPALVLLVLALYTLVAYAGRRRALWYSAGLIAELILESVVLDRAMLENVLLTISLYALSWITAEFLGARRAYDREVAARLEVAESDRDRRAEDAVAQERTRIARELHDVVAHAVSVMIVQADGASYALHSNPERAERALENIAATGRAALAELRRTVVLLRAPQAPERLPAHGTAGVAELAELMRRAGLPVRLDLHGELDDIAPSVSLGLHRVVQESLTNVLRHANPGAEARVVVRRGEREVAVTVTDTGTGSPAAGPARFGSGSGTGLLGMRERVAVLGGTLEAGPAADGTWAVRAVLPLPDPDTGAH
ncbi:sensor histidine kinase [Speluncibacter jeojiensis]|uniref:histidine kinase n=1 Tax=Speluncibacter jeojiensis TaxID=2710754 RepID=A0A9X4RJG9_9ACTN|nr:histidine kinase [Corynebacteriales bacterium D3-21]